MSDYDNIDLVILQTIDMLREEHHACTARRVGELMRVSPDVVRYRLQKMEGEGLVTWTEMPGSLRRTDEGRSGLVPLEANASTEQPEGNEPESPAESQDQPPATPRRSTKKAPARKKSAA